MLSVGFLSSSDEGICGISPACKKYEHQKLNLVEELLDDYLVDLKMSRKRTYVLTIKRRLIF